MQQILVSLSSFGAAEVRRHGQLYFARLSRSAGADGVEVREELLSDPASEIPPLAQFVREAGMTAVYSSPAGLWREDGGLDAEALDAALRAAGALGAGRLKMSIGGFGANSVGTFPALLQRIGAGPVELVIENDQTAGAGTLGALCGFFRAAASVGAGLRMTFDMGNWHWTGECPLQAAQALAAHVVYVHCKGVQRQPHRWIAVPLAESAAPWRAVLSALPAQLPWAIEYPLAGDDLVETTCSEIRQLRQIALQPRGRE
jgi:sugar phosphate isomerase/epimerase